MAEDHETGNKLRNITGGNANNRFSLSDPVFPENLEFFTKTFENGEKAQLVMTPQAVAELGGRDRVDRVFQMTIDNPGLNMLFTRAEMDTALKGTIPQSADEKERINHQLHFLHEKFNAVSLNLPIFNADIRPPEKGIDQAQKDFFRSGNANFPGENPRVNLIMLDLSIVKKDFERGPLTQEPLSNFIFAHELDHSDNRRDPKSKHDHAHREFLSDMAGTEAMQAGTQEARNDFLRRVISARIENQIEDAMQFGEYASTNHHVGFHLASELDKDLDMPVNIHDLVRDFNVLMEENDGSFTDALKNHHQIPQNPLDFHLNNDRALYDIFARGFHHILQEMDLPIEDKTRLLIQNSEQFLIKPHIEGQIINWDMEEKLPKIRAMINELEKLDAPQFHGLMEKMAYNDLYGMIFEEYGIPEERYLPYMEEMSYLSQIEDEGEKEYARVEFMKRFVQENNDIYQDAMYMNYGHAIQKHVRENDRDAWRSALAEYAVGLKGEEGAQHEVIQKALQIFAEENGVEWNTSNPPAPADKPAL